MRSGYDTHGKKVIAEFLKNHSDSHFTVDEIIKGIEKEGEKTSRSSVYRQISKMYESGELSRFESPGKSNFVYQYVHKTNECDGHCHLKCIECGKLIHLDCEKMNGIKEHILLDHGFTIGRDSIISGICGDCKSKGGENSEENS